MKVTDGPTPVGALLSTSAARWRVQVACCSTGALCYPGYVPWDRIPTSVCVLSLAALHLHLQLLHQVYAIGNPFGLDHTLTQV